MGWAESSEGVAPWNGCDDFSNGGFLKWGIAKTIGFNTKMV
jgi:hypothetical protein